MSEKKVLSEEEINEIKGVKESFQILVGQVGEIEIGIMNLNKRKEELGIELVKIQEEEKNIALKLEEKYGKGNISLETNEFTPIE
jgi:hypothetical protein|tara:strand:- start:755 stop:1009 length:255 start_codon:yes stop_codon:yes gene_type:complete